MPYITLDQAPKPLKEHVESVMSRYGADLLTVSVREGTPYMDKTTKRTVFTAYLVSANYFSTCKWEECTKGEWSSQEIRETGMIAADIAEFAKHSEFLRDCIALWAKKDG